LLLLGVALVKILQLIECSVQLGVEGGGEADLLS
jgi:hypothetical protein